MVIRPVRGLLVAAVLIVVGIAAFPPIARSQSDAKPAQPPTAATPARLPELIALKFDADWCDKCKAMAPALMETEKKIANKSVLIVKLDQTDKNSSQAEYLLAMLGMGNLWKEHAGTTGFVLLVDCKTKQVVGRLTPLMDAAAMTQAVDKALTGKPVAEQPKPKPARSEHPEHPKK